MKTFIVTRPKLAGRLLAAGHQGIKTVNPFMPTFDAWEFVLDEETVAVIRDYYEFIQCPLPKAIERWSAK